MSDNFKGMTMMKSVSLAGLLATLGILQGKGAEKFLDAQDVKYHCIR